MKRLSPRHCSLKVLSLAVIVLTSGTLYAQTPTITSFTPASGPVGTTVTITGTNFDTTPANNIVWFGAVKATVTAASATELNVEVPTGTTFQPITVTVNGLTAFSNKPFDVTFSSIKIIDASALAAKVDFPTGTEPWDVVISDFDGDSKPDLGITYGRITSTAASIYRNTSTSGFFNAGSFDAKVDFTTSLFPNNIAIGDIDGDGKKDLAVANRNSNCISVFRNTSTSGFIDAGSFSAKVDFTTSSSPYGTAIYDIDGDGKPELIVACATSDVISVFRNTSTSGLIDAGSFAARLDFTTGSYPYSLAIGDIDGDGKPDIAVSNNSGSTVSVFRNTSMAGTITSGSLADKVDFATGNSPARVAICDIDGDNKQDLVVINGLSQSLSIFRNTSMLGSIDANSFAGRIDFTTGGGNELAIGDINGDGKPDLAVTNYFSNTVSLFRNTSTPGSITNGSLAGKVDFSTWTGPISVAIGDIDGDGKPDIIVVNHNSNVISVLRNIIPEPVPPTITSFTPVSGPVGTNVTITGMDFNIVAENNSVWLGAVKATITGVTSTQLTVTVPAGSTYQPITVTDITTGLTTYSKTPFAVTFLSTREIDATSFATNVDFDTDPSPRYMATSDLDGDGKPDLVVTSENNILSIFRNNCTSGSILTGSFDARIDLTTGDNPKGVAIGDLDGDGKPDLVVSSMGSDIVSVFRNISTPGSILSTSFSPRIDFTTGTNPTSVVVRDIDGDGRPEMLVVNQTDNTVSVFRNTCSPGFITTGSFATRVDFTTGTTPYCIAIGDIDGDGNPDMAVTNNSDNSVSVFRNSSIKGSITPSSFIEKTDFITGTGPFEVTLADIDLDGKHDMLIVNTGTNNISVFRNTSMSGLISAGSFAEKVDFATGASPTGIGIGDINGDSKPDLAITNNSGNSVSVLRNTCVKGSLTAGSFAAKVDFTTSSGPLNLVIGDFDGDGKPDLSVTNNNSSGISVLHNTIPAPALPVISSFAPASGPIGTTVTITGANFSTTASNNIVWFGAVKATILTASPTEITVTVPAGATYQPITVTVNGLTAYSAAPFNVTFTGTGLIDPNAFDAKVDFAAGTAPRSVTISDLDGDGKPDIAITNANSNSVSVYRNTSSSGSITAGSFASKVDFSTGSVPNNIAMGDIDGDGKPDLVVSNSGSNSVSVFRNTGTPGSLTSESFAARIDFTTGVGPEGIVIGDIDGDGKPDLAVANFHSTSVSVFRNTCITGSVSASSFSSSVEFVTGMGSNPYNVAIGDIDGDGKPDLAVTNGSGNTVSVFRNNSSSGSITTESFVARVDFTIGTGPHGIAFGDLDGDGKLDLTIANTNSNSISVLRNTSLSGSITTGSFAAKVDFTNNDAPMSVGIGDIDGDGKPDLVVSTGGFKVSVFRNTSTSGIIDAGSFATNADFTTGMSPFGFGIGDIDCDGKPDLVATNYGSNTVSVLRNRISEQILPSISYFSPTSGLVGTSVSINGTNFSTIPSENIVWFGAVKATVTAASATELTVTVPAGATYQPITVTVNGLTAYSCSPFIVTFPGSGIIDAAAFAPKVDFTSLSPPSYAAISDIDGDGKPDLAVVYNDKNTVSVYRNISTSGSFATGSFASKVDFTTGSDSRNVSFGDIDGDGKPDLIITNYNNNKVSVFRNTSTPGSITAGSFSSRVDFTTGNNPCFVAIGDIDVDGKPDLVITNWDSNTASIYMNTSNYGSITPSSFADKIDFPTGMNLSDIAIGDIDGDGKPELIVPNWFSNSVSIYRNTSTSGSITASSFAAKVDFTTGMNPPGIAVGDIDGDGKPDLVVANSSDNTISVFRNTSISGSITSGSFAAKVDFTTGSNPHNITIGDIDGDGKPDLVIENLGNTSVSILRNTSTSGSISSGSFATKVDFTIGIGTNAISVAIGDIDGDSKPDLIVTNSGNNTVSVLRNTISEPMPPSITSFTPTSGPIGTTVIITGSNFSPNGGDNIVRFGDLQANISEASNTQLTVTVPNGATTNPISVTVNGLTGYSSMPFNVTPQPNPPFIGGFNPTSGPVGTIVTINGANFSQNPENNTVMFGDAQATVIGGSENQITVIVPEGADGQIISVTVNGLTAYSTDTFTVTVPEDLMLESSILTLNGDGINERFVVKNFQSYGKCSFYVYNSRGALVYWNKDFQGEWDVTLHNRRFDTGGYFYIIETELGTFRGSFSILRR